MKITRPNDCTYMVDDVANGEGTMIKRLDGSTTPWPARRYGTTREGLVKFVPHDGGYCWVEVRHETDHFAFDDMNEPLVDADGVSHDKRELRAMAALRGAGVVAFVTWVMGVYGSPRIRTDSNHFWWEWHPPTSPSAAWEL